jgi:chromosome segregation ATPase
VRTNSGKGIIMNPRSNQADFIQSSEMAMEAQLIKALNKQMLSQESIIMALRQELTAQKAANHAISSQAQTLHTEFHRVLEREDGNIKKIVEQVRKLEEAADDIAKLTAEIAKLKGKLARNNSVISELVKQGEEFRKISLELQTKNITLATRVIESNLDADTARLETFKERDATRKAEATVKKQAERIAELENELRERQAQQAAGRIYYSSSPEILFAPSKPTNAVSVEIPNLIFNAGMSK